MSNSFDDILFNAQNVLFVGMGNRIKSDDGIGIYIANKLEQKNPGNVIIAENSIENYIGKINSLHPENIIIIDALDFGSSPGYYELLPYEMIRNTTSNTHNLSLTTIFSFLEAPGKWVLGIQPENVSIGCELSMNIRIIANRIVDKILKSYNVNPKIHEL
jgi:hydrogenase maturation protease